MKYCIFISQMQYCFYSFISVQGDYKMNAQNSICFSIQVDVPYLTVREYARRTGLSEKAVRDLVQAGKLPTKTRTAQQEKIFINMIALAREAATQH